MTTPRDARPSHAFPLVLPAQRWRRWPLIALGRLASVALPWRARALVRGEMGGTLSRIDRLILAALVQRSRPSDMEGLGCLHDRFWARDGITDFHASVEYRFHEWFLPHHVVVMDAVQAELAAQPGRFTGLCEIGCGSGLLLDWLVGRFAPAGITGFVGLDLSAEQCRLNATRFADPRRRFIAGDATTWIPENTGPGWVHVAYGGVLEYIPQARLQALFAAIAARRPALIALVEPVAEDHDLTRDHRSKTQGAERSWSHDYPHLLDAAGFAIRYRQEQHVGGQRWLLVVAAAGAGEAVGSPPG